MRCLVLSLALLATAHAQSPSRLEVTGLTDFSEFGVAVAAGEGVLAVGAPGSTAPDADQGAVFVYAGDGSGPLVRLLAPGVVGRGYVGGSVALSPNGQFLIAGAPLDESEGIGTGAAFVWRREGGGWAFEAALRAGDAEAFDEFGQAVAVSDDGEAVVGAPFEGDGPTGGGGGAAYVFARSDGGVWTHAAKLQPAEVAAGDTFGRSVSIAAGVVAVGTPVPGPTGLPQPPTDPGYVYLFARGEGGPGAWGFTQRLTSADGENGDFFGGAVALADGRLAVGANQDQDAGPVTGAVYVFEPDGSGLWGQTSKLVPPGTEAGDGVGFAVALDAAGGRLVVSALGDDDLGPNAGAVYVYQQAGADWGSPVKVAESGGEARYGWSVGTSGVTFVVGAPADDVAGFAAGAAYASTLFIDAGEPGAPGEPGTGGLSLGVPAPHPAGAGARLGVASGTAGVARVTVVDALGRTVAALEPVVLAPGTEAAVALPPLPPGVYAVVVQQGEARAVRRVVVGR